MYVGTPLQEAGSLATLYDDLVICTYVALLFVIIIQYVRTSTSYFTYMLIFGGCVRDVQADTPSGTA
jgi:hypothetical protein